MIGKRVIIMASVNLKDNVPSFEKINLNKKSPVNKGIFCIFNSEKT